MKAFDILMWIGLWLSGFATGLWAGGILVGRRISKLLRKPPTTLLK